MQSKPIWLYVGMTATAVVTAIWLLEPGGVVAESIAAQSDRVAPGPLRCDFEGYEGVLNYEEASKREREIYALGMGYANRGSHDTHQTLRAAFKDLTFDPVRAPIVSTDLDSARLHVFDCAAERCTKKEIARDAPAACAEALGTRSCMTFAVRVDGNYYCTLGPGFNQ